MRFLTTKNVMIPQHLGLLTKLPKIILLYIFIFQPPFTSRTLYFVLEVLIFITYAYIRPKKLYDLIIKFKSEIILMLIILTYTLLRDLFAFEIVFSLRSISWFFQTFLFPLFIISIFNQNIDNKDNNHSNLFSISYWAVILASIFSLLLLINDSLNEFYKSLTVIDYTTIKYNTRIYRGYGIAENLTFTYSYLLGLIAGYSLYILQKKWIYIIYVPILILGVLFNARLGLIPIFIFVFFLFFRRKQNLKLISILVISITLIIIYLPKIGVYKYFEHNMEWFSSMFSGSTINTLLGDFLIFPTKLSHWLFGSGVNLFLSETPNGFSDIGYINQLNYGGIPYLFLLLFLIFIMSYRLIVLFGLNNWFTIIFILSVLVLNFKGSAFTSTPGMRFLNMFYVYLIIKEKSNNYKEMYLK